MKRFFGIIIGCVLAFSAAHSQQPADSPDLEKIYIGAPLEICPMLTPQQRFELIENAKAGNRDTIKNFMNGKTWVEFFDNQHLLVYQTENSSLELVLRNDKIFAISTYYAPLASSHCFVYNTKWEREKEFRIGMDDCNNMPATFVKAQIQGDSILLENQSLNQIFEIEGTEYRDCQRYKTIPLTF